MKTFIWNLLVNCIGKSYLLSDKVRYGIYRFAGMRTKTKKIRSGCTFIGKSIFIGKNVLINHNCFIDGWERVEIQDNVSIAYNVTICTSSHFIGKKEKRAGDSNRQPVVIEKGSWIGANTIILPNVTIGEGCVIGAGSVVTKSTEPNCLYAGNPAQKIKTLD